MVPYIDIFKALNSANIKYIVAGGIAVNLHGVERATADLDLVVHLEKENLLAFAEVITKLGYVPRVPVKAADFANEELRRKWIEEKNMIVFSFINPDEPMEMVDVFIDHPLPFDQLYKNKVERMAFETTIPVIGVEDLIILKERAGRPKDQYDLSLLKTLVNK